MVVFCPVHATGLCGGAAANVFPAVGQLIGQAVALMLKGGNPESKTGEGNFPPLGGVLWN